MEPTAQRDLQQLRPKNEIFLCRLQVYQRTHLPLLHSLSSPLSAAAALLRHFAVHLEICALIWRSETETAATATGQDWDSSGRAQAKRNWA